MLVLPLWERRVMRVLALGRNEALPDASGAVRIHGVSRIDVVTSPALGCGAGKLMSARLEPVPGPRSRPFSGPRLANAIWRPSPPDMLVAASAETRSLIPEEAQRGLPWILVLTAWRRLHPLADTALLEACWNHGHDGFSTMGELDGLEREAWFLALALNQLLHHAPPDELVALSR